MYHGFKLAKGENIAKIVDSHIYINVTYLQAASFILLLGYALAVVCFVTWYRLCQKAEFHQVHVLLMDEYKYTQLMSACV